MSWRNDLYEAGIMIAQYPASCQSHRLHPGYRWFRSHQIFLASSWQLGEFFLPSLAVPTTRINYLFGISDFKNWSKNCISHVLKIYEGGKPKVYWRFLTKGLGLKRRQLALLNLTEGVKGNLEFAHPLCQAGPWEAGCTRDHPSIV